MQHYDLKSNVRKANVVKIGFINDRQMSHLVFKTTAEEIFDRRICNIYFEYKKESLHYKQKIIDFSSSSKHNETVSYHNCQFAFSSDRDFGPNLFYRKRIRVQVQINFVLFCSTPEDFMKIIFSHFYIPSFLYGYVLRGCKSAYGAKIGTRFLNRCTIEPSCETEFVIG